MIWGFCNLFYKEKGNDSKVRLDLQDFCQGFLLKSSFHIEHTQPAKQTNKQYTNVLN